MGKSYEELIQIARARKERTSKILQHEKKLAKTEKEKQIDFSNTYLPNK